ncbi:hypothetical protein AN465_08630 [Pseudomonas aeruginosa]|nr:hypothetical protein YQ19_30170 [Pseudomonas aeruginosa]CDI94369.1 hypothetical protein BN889_06359 [Pseudomonas aeruginosa PA38182]ARG48730.1 hypothetical protein BFV99_05170 [Pseudomonas aeruginosa]KTF51017.1 hypothetical protein WM51_20070 [Pseudomonas aeruginosa]OFB87411.1 hypothetical protein AN472_16835 [Pseudomonas aeruginosa]
MCDLLVCCNLFSIDSGSFFHFFDRQLSAKPNKSSFFAAMSRFTLLHDSSNIMEIVRKKRKSIG